MSQIDKPVKQYTFFKNLWKGIYHSAPFEAVKAALRLLGRVKNNARDFLRDTNMFSHARKEAIGAYLKKHTSADPEQLEISWQPVVYVGIKIAVIIGAGLWLYSFYPMVAEWMKIGLDFFKLHEIYNFDFPSILFFEKIASWVLGLLIVYHGGFILYHQLVALFSSLSVDPVNNKVYYLENILLKKDLYVFEISEIDLVILRQNILFRFLGMGTLIFQKKSGDQVKIISLKQANEMMKLISRLKSPKVSKI
ncbi:MAG: PH domain-containing protein [Spirochaetales bacterium]|nr:PH domain-containing protein [Spirochaetales bacterium]